MNIEILSGEPGIVVLRLSKLELLNIIEKVFTDKYKADFVASVFDPKIDPNHVYKIGINDKF